MNIYNSWQTSDCQQAKLYRKDICEFFSSSPMSIYNQFLRKVYDEVVKHFLYLERCFPSLIYGKPAATYRDNRGVEHPQAAPTALSERWQYIGRVEGFSTFLVARLWCRDMGLGEQTAFDVIPNYRCGDGKILSLELGDSEIRFTNDRENALSSSTVDDDGGAFSGKHYIGSSGVSRSFNIIGPYGPPRLLLFLLLMERCKADSGINSEGAQLVVTVFSAVLVIALIVICYRRFCTRTGQDNEEEDNLQGDYCKISKKTFCGETSQMVYLHGYSELGLYREEAIRALALLSDGHARFLIDRGELVKSPIGIISVDLVDLNGLSYTIAVFRRNYGKDKQRVLVDVTSGLDSHAISEKVYEAFGEKSRLYLNDMLDIVDIKSARFTLRRNRFAYILRDFNFRVDTRK